jgi:hypothetical protein
MRFAIGKTGEGSLQQAGSGTLIQPDGHLIRRTLEHAALSELWVPCLI